MLAFLAKVLRLFGGGWGNFDDVWLRTWYLWKGKGKTAATDHFSDFPKQNLYGQILVIEIGRNSDVPNSGVPILIAVIDVVLK
jgi:hypothetical protein